MCTKFIVINGNVGDYVSCSIWDAQNIAQMARQGQKLVITQTPCDGAVNELYDDLARSQSPLPNKKVVNPVQNSVNSVLARIHRDLSSPSASVRVRALKALKSPTKSDYNQFDVPHAEQSIITAEERAAPNKPKPTIQEIMRNIIVYVEVRTDEDNRSSGVKKVIAALGARINDKLLRDTTHVIFKDGLLSTYKKAKSWNIPIVSILWIEACRINCRICDPKDYPISNLDRYEHPELYDKMKRHKAMQPDSECSKRLRSKPHTPAKDMQMKECTKTTLSNNGTPKTPKTKKTQITQYFGLLSKGNANSQTVESPATQLLNKMTAEVRTPQGNSKTSNQPKTKTTVETKKTISKNSPVQKSLNKSTPSTNHAQQNLTIASDINATIHSIADMSLDKESNNIDNNELTNATKARKSLRRRTCYSSKTMDISDNKTKNCTPSIPKSRAHLRRTLYEQSEMEETTLNTQSLKNTDAKLQKSDKNTNVSNSKSFVRSESSESETIHSVSKNQNGLRCVSLEKEDTIPCVLTKAVDKEMLLINLEKEQELSSMLDEEEDTSNMFVSTRYSDGRRRTVFGMPMNVVSQRLEGINRNARRSVNVNQFDFENGKVCIPQKSPTMPHLSASTILCKTKIPTADIELSVRKSFSAGALSPQRKRKLFVPETFTTPILDLSKKSVLNRSQSPVVQSQLSNRRRRTLMPSIPKRSDDSTSPTLNPICSTGSNKGQQKKPISRSRRRSTLDFQTSKERKSIHVDKENLKISVQETKCVKKPNSPKAMKDSAKGALPAKNANPKLTAKSKKDASSVKLINTEKGSNSNDDNKSIKNSCEINVDSKTDTNTFTDSNANTKKEVKKSKSKLSLMVCTNMHGKQMKNIQEAIRLLGGFRLSERVNEETTHLISYEPRRTINLLRGLVRGLWILDYKWVTDSLKEGYWLPEEQYEMKDFSRAVEICRSERQAFGVHYRCELFSDLGPFYISSRSGPIDKDHLVELVELCGGRVTNHRTNAKYILGSTNRYICDKTYITPYWILDSITQMQLQKLQGYLPAYDCTRPIAIKRPNCMAPSYPDAFKL